VLAQKAAVLQNDADTLYVLSWAYEANGYIKDSLRAISRAIELAPNNADYKRTYEQLKKQEGQNDK
jgi:cytochrome c-type biogenesis protein CcmH/NrfG